MIFNFQTRKVEYRNIIRLTYHCINFLTGLLCVDTPWIFEHITQKIKQTYSISVCFFVRKNYTHTESCHYKLILDQIQVRDSQSLIRKYIPYENLHIQSPRYTVGTDLSVYLTLLEDQETVSCPMTQHNITIVSTCVIITTNISHYAMHCAQYTGITNFNYRE